MGFAAAPLLFAQPNAKPRRISYFFVGSRDAALKTGRYAPFLEGMKLLGYFEGKDYLIDAKFADGDGNRFAPMAKEIVALKPDVIVATGSPLYPPLAAPLRPFPSW